MAEQFSDEKDESLDQEAPSQVSEDEAPQEELPDALAECTEELSAERDQRLRLAAEFANYRRRMENQRVEWPARARATVIRPLLPILDDLERSLDVAGQTESEDAAFLSLRSGVNLVYKNFIAELEKFGLERIQALGMPFDENLHEAVGQAPAAEGSESGSVLHESQAGYRLGDRVLRHAQVIVAFAPEPSATVEADIQ
ncbi:MAG: nucleotide exchange factor GrpE [Bacteroidetes bacterium]|nr:nucleotide exchange factor GrpE [Bacteroidota bacterium]